MVVSGCDSIIHVQTRLIDDMHDALTHVYMETLVGQCSGCDRTFWDAKAPKAVSHDKLEELCQACD